MASPATLRRVIGKSDLTHKISKYLDPHGAIHLLEFAEGADASGDALRVPVYAKSTLAKAKATLLAKTSRVDEEIAARRAAGLETSEAEARKASVAAKYRELREACGGVGKLLLDDSRAQELKSMRAADEFNAATLREDYNVEGPAISALLAFGRHALSCGKFDEAATALSAWLELTPSAEENRVAAQWALLTALTHSPGRGADAARVVATLADQIDKQHSDPLQQLHLRLALVNRAAVALLATRAGAMKLLDMFFTRESRGDREALHSRERPSDWLTSTQNTCPWLMRYLVVTAMAVESRLRVTLLSRAVENELRELSDPVLRFVRALGPDLDFEAAHEHLRDAEVVLRNDPLLAGQGALVDAFLDQARLELLWQYCKVHEKVSLRKLAEDFARPGADEEGIAAVERRMVSLIRDDKLDARIDSETGHVFIKSEPYTVYQDIADKTNTLSDRATVLWNGIQREKR